MVILGGGSPPYST